MHTMHECGCVAALSSSDALNEEGPGIQQMEESTEATEQPSHSSDNLQDPDRVFTFTAASVEDDVKRMPKKIRALLAFEIAKAERQEIIHTTHDLTTKTVSFKKPPLFVTPDERAELESIDWRTVIEIEVMINDAIASIIDLDLHGISSKKYLEIFHRGKKPLKKSYIDFYLYVKSCSELYAD
ncbi:hypothetical protein CAPTEDRAFT_194736 [Capitella teleta]|uniref:Uncharacterized protein n=1 Tax=Capitella teleta TaxID=283909 RepID=R7VCA5_CAPTE|nr:hypothetical protein CAPTEDRAFT_194736 [Capitella teleta]|eukprot:ELU16249.1 hypothetical protein CAPTEDRAFT_194736 [Capitella teleta]